ncbi:hypothetical protein CXG81DRAFT_26513 [Caulochytrium protostelioides]|uniref:BAR-domain-containing protein n=1 Tax=Caulochytrium protostelioides TaxID=1555241 RepID=A0A4P9WUV2_9FUNG|nr:BAR-domain-containing protein [Caulochytrium protostelioides]RKP00770.1 hypothetical protein CXG81DRAFT_26513 [Caulochytrium protostelioides]|eukprot:RKP00770.1 hypothetical protein CXG81DRAFT_26513 [Caulochytrium protostelioides]
MSWNGFKKAVSRATTTVMQSTGQVDKTVDPQFDAESARFHKLEQQTEQLYTESRGYLDAVRAMTLAQQRIAETLEAFYEEGSEGSRSGRAYKTAVERLDADIRLNLDPTYRETVLDPIGKLLATFPHFNEALKKRSKKQLDYDRTRTTVRKLIEKPSDDPTRLPRAEAEARAAQDVYERLNAQLLTEIPKLVDMRVGYMEPCFEALVKSQALYAETALREVNDIARYFPEASPAGQEGAVESVLDQIKGLAICAHV